MAAARIRGYNFALVAPAIRPPVSAQTGQVAQLVEQRTENPRVDGSIPSLATKFLVVQVLRPLPSSLGGGFCAFWSPRVGVGCRRGRDRCLGPGMASQDKPKLAVTKCFAFWIKLGQNYVLYVT